MCMCVPEYRYGHLIHAGTCRGQKRASGSLEMELRAVVIWVLGETCNFGRAASVLVSKPSLQPFLQLSFVILLQLV